MREKNVEDASASTALRFVLIIGIVNLFADLTYEGAHSITGPYLAMLGASAVVVGSVAGFGELVGIAILSFDFSSVYFLVDGLIKMRLP